MGVEFELPLVAEGSVTAPSGSFVFNEPSAESEVFLDSGPVNTLEIPEFGWCVADGVNPLRFIVDGGVYEACAVAPSAAPTMVVTGAAQASVNGSYTGQPSNADILILGRAITINWKTTLVTDGSEQNQIKIGGTAAASYDNLEAFIMGTGTQGTEYFDYDIHLGFNRTVQERAFFTAVHDGVDDILFTDTQYGTVGNTALASDATANFTFDGAATKFTGGSDGSGTAPNAGTYRYFTTYYNSVTGAETGRSPIGTITQTTNTNITVSFTDCVDTDFDYTRIYRTTDSGVEYFLSGAVANGTETYNDTVSDTDLIDQNFGIAWDDLTHRTYENGPPPRGRALAYWSNRVWSLGAHLASPYSSEEVAVTNGSATITLVDTGTSNGNIGWTANMVGRTFNVTGTAEKYRILSIDESAGTGVINRVYEGTTDPHVGYTFTDDYDACRLRASVPDQYGQWPEDESPGRVDTDDPEGGTALLATRSRLFGFSKSSIVAITGDNLETWTRDKVADGVGCVAPRMVTAFEGGGAFLSTDGIYLISPDGLLTCVSSPKVPRGSVAQGIDATINRIAWANADQGYAVYDREDRVLAFGVPLDGSVVPDYEIVLDLQNNLWTLYKRAAWTSEARILLPDGSQAMLAGDRDGCLWHVNLGASDGHYGAESVRTLTAASARVLTDSSASFTTDGDGEDGKPVLVLSADGETLQYGKVASNTGTALTLAEDLSTTPAVGDQIVLGGIAWQAKSGFATYGEEYRVKTLRKVVMRHAPTTRGDYFFSFAVDDGSFQLCPRGTSVGDLTDKTGKVWFKTEWPGDSHAINIRGFKPGGRATIRGGVFDLTLRELGQI